MNRARQESDLVKELNGRINRQETDNLQIRSDMKAMEKLFAMMDGIQKKFDNMNMD